MIAPNIIVLDRIYRDFQGLRIFFADPVVPDNGFEGRNWRDDFQLTLHKQDEVRVTQKFGNIFLTNIHRVYSGEDIPPSADDENTMDYFLGKRPTGGTTDSNVDLGTIVRDIDELMVLNDEAHHIHDKSLAWFQSIQDMHNRLVLKDASLSLQLDVTATPLSGRLSFYADEHVAGRPLVLLHSINAAASAFEVKPLFEHFRKQRPVFALDLPGFGFSERADRGYTSDVFIQCILDFIDGELSNSSPVDVIALSLTSEFAAIAALEQPSAFHDLAFIAPTGFSTRTMPSSDRLHRALTFPLWSQAAYDALVTRASINYFLQKAFEGPVDADLAEYDYLTAHRPCAKNAPFHFVSGKLFKPDIREFYGAMTQQVLAFPDLSDYGPSELLPQFCRDYPNWKMRYIEGTKSLPHFERPEETFAALDAFFNRAG